MMVYAKYIFCRNFLFNFTCIWINGNESEVHWDMVLIQTPEYGGGEIYFDGELVRRDGLFVTEDLKALNPDALK